MKRSSWTTRIHNNFQRFTNTRRQTKKNNYIHLVSWNDSKQRAQMLFMLISFRNKLIWIVSYPSRQQITLEINLNQASIGPPFLFTNIGILSCAWLSLFSCFILFDFIFVKCLPRHSNESMSMCRQIWSTHTLGFRMRMSTFQLLQSHMREDLYTSLSAKGRVLWICHHLMSMLENKAKLGSGRKLKNSTPSKS